MNNPTNTGAVIKKQGGLKFSDIFLKYGFYFTFIVLFIVFSVFGKSFLTPLNLTLVLSDCAPYFVLAGGVTMVILCGNLDLSVSSGMLTSGIITIYLVGMGVPVFVAVAASLAVGLGIGFFNGFCVTKLRMNAFILTLGVQVVLKGIGLTITKANSSYTQPEIKDIFGYRIGGYFPVFLIVAVGVMIAMQFMLKYSAYGRSLMATGCNRESAQKIGINTGKVITGTFMISGVCAALGGIISAVNIGSISAGVTGKGVDFLAATMVLIGGTSLFGGKGSVIPGTMFGVILMIMIENGLTIMGADPYYMPIIRGIIIFAALFMDTLKNMKK